MTPKITATLLAATLLSTFGLSARAAAFGNDLTDLDTSNSELRPMIERYAADRGNLLRFYNVNASPERRERLRRFYLDAKAALADRNFDAMSQDGRIDYVLFRNSLDHELQRLDLDAQARLQRKHSS